MYKDLRRKRKPWMPERQKISSSIAPQKFSYCCSILHWLVRQKFGPRERSPKIKTQKAPKLKTFKSLTNWTRNHLLTALWVERLERFVYQSGGCGFESHSFPFTFTSNFVVQRLEQSAYWRLWVRIPPSAGLFYVIPISTLINFNIDCFTII